MKNQQKAGDLLQEAVPGMPPSRETLVWSTDEVARMKMIMGWIMEHGYNSDNDRLLFADWKPYDPAKADEGRNYPPVCPGWQWKPGYREQYNAVFLWALGIECECQGRTVRPGRGLWLAGNPGTGKSTLMKCLKVFCCLYADPRSPNMPRPMLWRHAKDISDEFEQEGTAVLDRYVLAPTLIIDDLGTEDREARNYGSVKNTVEDILSRRYDKGVARRMTMVTTNLSMKNVKENYKGRLWDRVREAFNVIYFMGSSYRKNFNPDLNTDI